MDKYSNLNNIIHEKHKIKSQKHKDKIAYYGKKSKIKRANNIDSYNEDVEFLTNSILYLQEQFSHPEDDDMARRINEIKKIDMDSPEFLQEIEEIKQELKTNT